MGKFNLETKNLEHPYKWICVGLYKNLYNF